MLGKYKGRSQSVGWAGIACNQEGLWARGEDLETAGSSAPFTRVHQALGAVIREEKSGGALPCRTAWTNDRGRQVIGLSGNVWTGRRSSGVSLVWLHSHEEDLVDAVQNWSSGLTMKSTARERAWEDSSGYYLPSPRARGGHVLDKAWGSQAGNIQWGLSLRLLNSVF